MHRYRPPRGSALFGPDRLDRASKLLRRLMTAGSPDVEPGGKGLLAASRFTSSRSRVLVRDVCDSYDRVTDSNGVGMWRTAKWVGVLSASALIIGVPGCGGSDPGPRETVETFFQAIGNGDGAKACSLITDELLLSEGQSRAECASALTFAPDDPDREQFGGASANIVSVKEEADRATVTMTDFEYDRIVLERQDGKWMISDLVD